jgi:hypothetical protein
MRADRIVILVVALVGLGTRPAAAGGSGTIFASVGLAKLLQDGAPDGSAGFGLGGIYRPPASPLGFGAEIGLLLLGSVNRTATFSAGNQFAEVSLRTVPITAQVYYHFPPGAPTQGYAIAGAGVYATTTRASAQVLQPDESTYGTTQETVTDFGFNVGGGVAFGTHETGLTYGADARIHFIQGDGGSDNVLTVAARVFFN